jgi:CubicO group peptidase (beta-lactamase class C family)
MKKITVLSIVIIIFGYHSNAQSIEKQIDTLIAKAITINRFNGTVLVSQKGRIIYEKAFGYQDFAKQIPNTTNTIYQIGSTTKEFTAAIILQLAEQSKLSLEDRLNKYFTDFKRGNEITIKHLLTHTSGIYEILRDTNAVKQSTTPRSKEKMLSFFANKDLDFDPGTQYAYCNSGYMLLGLIIEKVTNQSYEETVRKRILTPLGMTHSGFDFAGLHNGDKALGYTKYSSTTKEFTTPWDSTATYSAGAMYSTVEDLNKWHKGIYSLKVYSAVSLDKVTTPFLQGYGLGCWIDTIYGKKVVSHGGNILGFTGYFGRIQEEDICIIILNNIFNHQIETIGQSILAIMYNQPYNYFNEIKLSDSELEKFTGNYDVNTNYQVVISREANHLFIQRNKETKIEIFPYKATTFFQKDDDIRVSFGQNKITLIEGLSTRRGDKIL